MNSGMKLKTLIDRRRLKLA